MGGNRSNLREDDSCNSTLAIFIPLCRQILLNHIDSHDIHGSSAKEGTPENISDWLKGGGEGEVRGNVGGCGGGGGGGGVRGHLFQSERQ